jgi:hypothetical protein
MAEGAPAGAPTTSGLDSVVHSSHQPPPVSGLNLSNVGGSGVQRTDHENGDNSDDGGCGDDSGTSHRHHRHHLSQVSLPTASPPASPPPEHSPRETNRLRAHFPDDHLLEQTFSARPRPITSNDRTYTGGEKDREPAAHRGVWQTIRNWTQDWKEDFGSPEDHQDITNLIGDTGIDPQVIRKMKSHGRVSSLVSSPGPPSTIWTGDHRY